MGFLGVKGCDSKQETPAPGTSEAKQWEEDWDDAGWDDEDQDCQQYKPCMTCRAGKGSSSPGRQLPETIKGRARQDGCEEVKWYLPAHMQLQFHLLYSVFFVHSAV